MNQCFKKPRRETTSENPTMTPETGTENPAPASIPGAGAGAIDSLSWAETTAKAVITRKRKNALETMT